MLRSVSIDFRLVRPLYYAVTPYDKGRRIAVYLERRAYMLYGTSFADMFIICVHTLGCLVIFRMLSFYIF